jgi:Na+-driven multidrug efflux pump
MSCVVLGGLLFVLAPLVPELYKTERSVKTLAKGFMQVGAVCMPIYAFMHATYFTLRTGGKTLVTFCFDSVFLLLVSIPVAFLLSKFTVLPVLMIYLAVQAIDLIKCIIGFILVKKGVWLQNLVREE